MNNFTSPTLVKGAASNQGDTSALNIASPGRAQESPYVHTKKLGNSFINEDNDISITAR